MSYVVKNNEYYYLLTKEYNPLFKEKQISKYSTITGGLENNNHYETVIKKLNQLGLNIKNNMNYFLINKVQRNKTHEAVIEAIKNSEIGEMILKTNNEEWQYYIKTLDEKFNKYFSLNEILEIEKDFVLKTFKEKANL